MTRTLKVVESVAKIAAEEWNALPGGNPFLRHEFFLALEQSGCATAATGWQTSFLLLQEKQKLIGAMPLYFKSHSFGEFVFDWAWADAYEQNGLAYYPKLVSSVPFTPVAGRRLLAASRQDEEYLVRGALTLAQQAGVSSLHILFPDESEIPALKSCGLQMRQAVQFHWRNESYRTFDSFLDGLRHEKRKKIKRERRLCREAGISFRLVRGGEATEADWDFFFLCYTRTHIQYNSPQAFNRDFFSKISRAMPENLLLVIAEREGNPIASAFNVFDDKNFYGRSWGATEFHPGLHFETCYYQAIEFCLQNGIETFEGGAQGEHKLSRGFLPVTTWSGHWLAHPEFSRAVEDFLGREENGMRQYIDELNDSNPFKRNSSL